MPDRQEQEMEHLEQQLLTLSRAMAYPAAPDLASGFWRRLDAEPARGGQARERAFSLAGLAVAAAVVAVSVLVATAAPARDAAADLFDRINIFEADEEAFIGLPTDITGDEITLAEAETRLGRPIPLPTYPEGIEASITRVLYQDFQPAPLKVAAVFFEPEDSTPFVLFATNGGTGKGLGYGAEAEPLEGFEGEAYWLTGRRIVQYYDIAEGFVREAQRVTDANTLIWTLDGTVYRLEGGLGRDEAIKIAQSAEVR